MSNGVFDRRRHFHSTKEYKECLSLISSNRFWKITVWCAAEELDADGMVVDFVEIEHRLLDALDHRDLNEVLPFNPTTENLARWICERIPHCYKVEVEESPGNEASYEK